jgi:hypothetical protein
MIRLVSWNVVTDQGHEAARLMAAVERWWVPAG